MIKAREIQTGAFRLDIAIVLIWLFLFLGSVMDIVQNQRSGDLRERVESLEKKIETLPAPTPKESR